MLPVSVNHPKRISTCALVGDTLIMDNEAAHFAYRKVW